MIVCKFGIGQQIRHKLLGYPGVVIDIDPEYSLKLPHGRNWMLRTDCVRPLGIMW